MMKHVTLAIVAIAAGILLLNAIDFRIDSPKEKTAAKEKTVEPSFCVALTSPGVHPAELDKCLDEALKK